LTTRPKRGADLLLQLNFIFEIAIKLGIVAVQDHANAAGHQSFAQIRLVAIEHE